MDNVDLKNDAKEVELQEVATKNSAQKQKRAILLIAKTAAVLAVTLLLQYSATMLTVGIKPVSVFIIGSMVNLCMFVAVGTVGLLGGAVVAFVTPFVAFGTGHLPFVELAPLIGLSNFLMMCVFYFAIKLTKKNWACLIIALALASLIKYAAMHFGVLQIAKLIKGTVPAALNINYTYPQLVTALIASGLVIPVYMALYKAKLLLGQR